MNEKRLMSFLDFSLVKSKDEMLKQAHLIAAELMKNWEITTPKGNHRFLGLEFYLIIPQIFEDDRKKVFPNGQTGSTHKNSAQLTNACFYVHPPKYNRNGIDITCGNIEKNIYGGILLRHLSGINNCDGSGKALRVLLMGDIGFTTIPRKVKTSWDQNELNTLKKLNTQSIFKGEINLRWNPSDLSNDQIIQVPRINISGKKTYYSEEPLRFKLTPKNLLPRIK